MNGWRLPRSLSRARRPPTPVPAQPPERPQTSPRTASTPPLQPCLADADVRSAATAQIPSQPTRRLPQSSPHYRTGHLHFSGHGQCPTLLKSPKRVCKARLSLSPDTAILFPPLIGLIVMANRAPGGKAQAASKPAAAHPRLPRRRSRPRAARPAGLMRRRQAAAASCSLIHRSQAMRCRSYSMPHLRVA